MPYCGEVMSSEKFEKSLEKLEGIVKELEAGELDLEASLKAFEEGVRLSRVCDTRLSAAQKRVEVLLEEHGELSTKPFETEPSESLEPSSEA